MFDAVYLSPHFDDVVLSCGAQIWDRTRRGEQVLVETICAAPPPALEGLPPFAYSLHQRWRKAGELDRAKEDVLALAQLGATPSHRHFADCIYRRSEIGLPLYNSEADIFGPISPHEASLPDEIADSLSWIDSHLSPDAAIFIPRAIGNHVDHQLVRLAGERWGQRRGRASKYYADYPYAEAVAGGDAVPVSEAGKLQKIWALLAYRSQLPSFWPDEATMAEKVSQWEERTF